MSSGPSLPPNPPPAYQFQQMPQADVSSMTGISQLSGLNFPLQNYPSLQAAVGNITSGAYGAPAITNAGNQQLQTASQFGPYVASALGTGFDPQNQNYQVLFRQMLDQARAGEGQRGIQNTPYGAGIDAQAEQQFNMNWQQQMLQRQQQAAAIAAQLAGAQGTAAQSGAGLLTGAAKTPLEALMTLNQGGAAAANIPQTVIQDYLSYLQGGTGATQAGTAQYAAEAQAAIGEQQVQNQALSGIGSLFGNILGMFGGGMGG